MKNTYPYSCEHREINADLFSGIDISYPSTLDETMRITNRIEFNPITHGDMPRIWEFMKTAPGRTTDYSYGGILMWIDYFDYQYCIFEDTLFIKGKVEDNRQLPAFSHPIGKLSLKESVELLKKWCDEHGERLIFSAVPGDVLEEYMSLNPRYISELRDWGDYLYEAEQLATLRGKKMSKKRNHVNAFLSDNADWTFTPLKGSDAEELFAFMDSLEEESSGAESARIERELCRKIIAELAEGDSNMIGAVLRVNNRICAFTIGDIKGDTLFIHIEKGERNVRGSYEAINKLFAEYILTIYPEIKFINREDDAGDLGLRMAKESYHPCEILKKYNVAF